MNWLLLVTQLQKIRVIYILASLPENFPTIVMALEAIEKVLTWEMVMEQLLHEENKKTKADTDMAFVSNKTRREKKTMTYKCYEYGKLVHKEKL